jgi:hypothetical protein
MGDYFEEDEDGGNLAFSGRVMEMLSEHTVEVLPVSDNGSLRELTHNRGGSRVMSCLADMVCSTLMNPSSISSTPWSTNTANGWRSALKSTGGSRYLP